MDFDELVKDSIVADMLFPGCSMHELWQNNLNLFYEALDGYASELH